MDGTLHQPFYYEMLSASLLTRSEAEIANARHGMTRQTEPVPVSLSGIRLLASIAPDALSDLEARCLWRHFDAGQTILKQLDRSRDVFFLVTGEARAMSYAMSGREIAFRKISAGEIFGEFAAIDGKGRASDVVAVSDVIVASVSHNFFLELMTKNPDSALMIMRHLVEQLRQMSERIYDYRARKVRNRIFAALLRLAQQHSRGQNRVRIPHAPKHADLASLLDTHREAVPRVLQELYREGIIARRGRALIINDLGELARRAEEGEEIDRGQGAM